MKNLTPPIRIFQYYQAYKSMILTMSNLPNIRNKTHLSQEHFQALWNKANSIARDLLVFMWVLRDLLIPTCVVEGTTTNPPFYITRFCTSTLAHINKNHKEVYSSMHNRNSLPQLEPYDLELVKEIQDMASSQFPDFLLALDNLAGEDTTLLHEASHTTPKLVQEISGLISSKFPPDSTRTKLFCER